MMRNAKILTTFMILAVALVWAVNASGSGEGRLARGGSEETHIVSIEINDGAAKTNEREITIKLEFIGRPTEYIVCEDKEFVDCHWKRLPFNGIIKFILSEGSGIKKLYFRGKYLGKPGKIKTATIELIKG